MFGGHACAMMYCRGQRKSLCSQQSSTFIWILRTELHIVKLTWRVPSHQLSHHQPQHLHLKSVLPKSGVSQVHGSIKKIKAKGQQISLKQEKKKNEFELAVVLNRY